MVVSNTFVVREILSIMLKPNNDIEMMLPTLKLCIEVDITEHEKHSKNIQELDA